MDIEDELPQRVSVLDENFLVVNPRANVRCSAALRGFHFYAPDMCLRAHLEGHASYVVDFHLRHLGSGKLDDSFWKLRDEFQAHWQNQFHCVILKTVTGVHVCLSKHRLVRMIFESRFVSERLLRPRIEYLLWFFRLQPI
jgi:hypothetical protein